MKRRNRLIFSLVFAAGLWTSGTAQAQDTITNAAQFTAVFDEPGLSYPLVYPSEPTTFQPIDTWFLDFTALTNAIGAIMNYPGQTQNGVTVWPLRLIQTADTGEVVLKYAGTNEVELLQLAAPTGYAPFHTYDAMLPSFCLLSCAMNPTNYDALIADGYTFLDPPRVVMDVWAISAADEDAYFSYEGSAGWGGFTAMSGNASPMFIDGDPCSITNDAQPFSIVDIYQDTNLYTTITWESCTNFTYTVLSADELTFETMWVERATVPGEANTTSWTDTTTTNVPARFYKVERMHFNEWNGPFASWDNLKTTYGAHGDGVTDDTAAISKMFANIGVGTNSPVVYVPNGTYIFTQQMYFALRDGVRIVGQDPAGVKFLPSGSVFSGTYAIYLDQTPRCSIERIAFDGSAVTGGSGNCTLIDQSATGGCNTGMQYLECVFTNADYGLLVGVNSPGCDSEISVVRCKFYSMTSVGLDTTSQNAVDIWVQDSELAYCRDGLEGTGGGFNAYENYFHDNTNDMEIRGAQPFFGIRDNVSTNSEKFLFVFSTHGSAGITLQRNLVVDPTVLPCVDANYYGQLALIDNMFLTSSGTIVSHVTPDSPCDSLSISNSFTTTNAESLAGRSIIIDDQVVTRPANSGTIVLSAVATNVQRFATNLWSGATATDIQAAIYAVTNRIGQRPVVHIPWGAYNISQTIVVPGGADIQIEGDSAFGATPTELTWSGSVTGLVMQLGSPGNPTTATLRNIEINCGGNAVTGIVANVSNGKLWSRRLFLQNRTDIGYGICLLARGCTNATIDLLDFEHAGGSNDVVVDNCAAPIRIRGGVSSNSRLVYNLTNTVNICIEDIWFEGTVSNEVPHITNDFIYAHAGSTGSFTIQGFQSAVYRPIGPKGECAIFTNWNGVALISQGEVYDRIVPASGSGSLWLNGLEYNNVSNPFSTSGSLSSFNANNCQTSGGSDIADYLAVNTNLVYSTMSQVRSTRALQNPDPGSAVMESVVVNNPIVGLLVQ